MLILGLNETMDQLAITSSLHWYCHVLRMALKFEVEGQRKKGWLKRTWKKPVEKESMQVGLSREDALCRSNWIVF